MRVHPGRRDERGAIAVYAAVLVPVLALTLMFFVDAACRWNTWRDATAAADAAARAAAEPSPAEFVGGQLVLKADLAQARASSVLAVSGYVGKVSVTSNVPPTVTVTVTARVDYVFSGGLGSSVTGTGTAVAESGVFSGG